MSAVSVVPPMQATQRPMAASSSVSNSTSTGPLVVAEFRSPVNSHRDNDSGHLDLDRLIDRNFDQ